MSNENKWDPEYIFETLDWLERHVPTAAEWFVLWRSDDTSKRIADKLAKDLPPHRRHHLIHARVDAERESALGLLAELILAEQRLDLAKRHLIGIPGVVAAVQAQRARIAELVAELQIDAAPTVEPESKP